jgi:hypothetical protein
VEIKPKKDGSMQWAASDSSTPNFAIFNVLGHKSSLVICFPIIRTTRAGGEVSIQPSLSHPLNIVAF